MSQWESASIDKGDISISYNDFSKICRICVTRENLKSLQEVEYLVDLLRIITNADVREDDGLPQNICNKCIHKLEEISDFIDLTKFNDSCLRHVYTSRQNLTANTVTMSNNSTKDSRRIESDNTEKCIDRNSLKVNLPFAEGIILSGTFSENLPHLGAVLQIVQSVDVGIEIGNNARVESDTSSLNKEYDKDNGDIELHSCQNKLILEHQHRVLRRREGNRKAAAKSRNKLRDCTINLIREMDEAETINASLKVQIRDLKEEKESLLKTLSRFKCTKKHLRLLEKKLKKENQDQP